MSANLLLSQWIGTGGLKAEIKRTETEQQKTIEEERARSAGDAGEKHFLVDDGRLRCHYCYGTGFREVTRGKYKGVIHCQHEEVFHFEDGDEVVGIEEGLKIIESYLKARGQSFQPAIKKVVYGNFGHAQ